MQTLGVALPWAISAALVRPNTQIISVSGDSSSYFQRKNRNSGSVEAKYRAYYLE